MNETAREWPLFSTRPHLWVRAHQPLVCPRLILGRPHRLRTNAAHLRDDAFICQWRPELKDGECNARVYVLTLPGGMRYLAEVTEAEFRYMRTANMKADEILEYLGSHSLFDA